MPKLSELTGAPPPRKLKLSDLEKANDSDFARMVSGEPKEMSTWDSVKHQAGLAARYLTSGPLELAGVFTDPIAIAAGLPTARQGAQDLGDRIGLPNPANGVERVAGDASKAMTGGLPLIGAGTVLARAPGVVGAVGRSLAARPGLQVLSAATGAGSASAAREGGASPGAQVVAGLAGGLAPGLVPAAGQNALRYLLRGGEEGRQRVVENVNAFARAGTTPSVGQATENRRTRGFESLLSATPGGSGPMVAAAERQAAQISDKVERSAAGLSPKSSATTAGAQIVRGVDRPGGFLDRFKARAGQLYGVVDQHFPPQTPVPVTNTKLYLARATAPIPGAPNVSARLANRELADLNTALDEDLKVQLTAAQQGTLPYEAIKALRTRIGEKIADAGLDPDIPTKQLRALYGALTSDVQAAVRGSGNRAAAAALARADAHYRAGMGRIDAISSVIEKNGGPEKVFGAALSGTREGATTLRAVMQSLKPDEAKLVTATFLRRLGRANPSNQNDLGDVFSTERFLTNWNSTSPEAKSALFGRMGPRFNADMDAIAKAAANLRSGSKVFANPSGTAARGAGIAALSSFGVAAATGRFGAAATIAGGAGVANVLARAFTSPLTVAWLARQSRLPAAAFPQQLAMLKRAGEAQGDDAAVELARDLARNKPDGRGNE